jgi:DNA-binding NtrC family response regulator
VSRHAVLILSADPLAAALLGAAIELAGHVALFPQQGESARAALVRLRPRVVLVDCSHEEACSEAFVGPAMMLGARVLLFAGPGDGAAAAGFALRLGLTIMELPVDLEQLAAHLRAVLGV